MNCHEAPTQATRKRCIALVGAPNSGKTSLFARLTGIYARAVNYPGATVEYSVGQLTNDWDIIDTPGTYSLNPKSQEESITRKLLEGRSPVGELDAVIVVVDATQMGRHLLLAKQIQESGFHTVVALTMMDLMEKSNVRIDVEALSKEIQLPIFAVNSLRREGIDKLKEAIEKMDASIELQKTNICTWPVDVLKDRSTEMILTVKKHLHWTKSSADSHRTLPLARRSRNMDRVLMHPVLGIFIFFCVMAAVFTSVFWFAAPLMDAIDQAFGSLGDWVLSQSPHSLWADLLANGVVAGFGAALVFVPQIAILFLAINILEDTGYLARAAALIDYPLKAIGLSGRSFVPLLSGYACAIPAMMAARTIPSRRERFLTLLIIPLMSCSARLPVFSLLLAFLFWQQAPWKAGLALAIIYFASLLVGAVISAILSRFIRNKEKSFFLLELPWYRRPEWTGIFQNVYLRTRSYVLAAAPLIALFSIGLWAATSFPKVSEGDERTQLEASYAGSLGQWLEPVMEPMGGDWRTGVSLIAAFAAREVFVSSLAVTLRSEDEEDMEGLVDKMREAHVPSGAPLFTAASTVALILFFMIALQCMATFGIARREFGSWKWPLVQLIGFNLLAWLAAVGAYQILRWL